MDPQPLFEFDTPRGDDNAAIIRHSPWREEGRRKDAEDRGETNGERPETELVARVSSLVCSLDGVPFLGMRGIPGTGNGERGRRDPF